MMASGIVSDLADKTLYSKIKTMSRNTKSVSIEQSAALSQIENT